MCRLWIISFQCEQTFAPLLFAWRDIKTVKISHCQTTNFLKLLKRDKRTSKVIRFDKNQDCSNSNTAHALVSRFGNYFLKHDLLSFFSYVWKNCKTQLNSLPCIEAVLASVDKLAAIVFSETFFELALLWGRQAAASERHETTVTSRPLFTQNAKHLPKAQIMVPNTRNIQRICTEICEQICFRLVWNRTCNQKASGKVGGFPISTM